MGGKIVLILSLVGMAAERNVVMENHSVECANECVQIPNWETKKSPNQPYISVFMPILKVILGVTVII